MMFRISQLRELEHSLKRARALSEELQLTHIAEATHDSIGKVSEEILKMGTQTSNGTTTTAVPKVRRQTKTENP